MITRFGLTLFMAGAGNAGRKYKIGSEEALSILIDYVVRLGNTENLARGFLQNIEEYLLETRYFTILIRAGRPPIAGSPAMMRRLVWTMHWLNGVRRPRR